SWSRSWKPSIRTSGFVARGDRLFHQQGAGNLLESFYRTEVEEAFLLVHADHACIIDRRPVQDRREVRIRGHVDPQGERAEGGQDEQRLRDEECGHADRRPEVVLQLDRGMLMAHDDRMERRDLLVPVDDRVPADVRPVVQREVEVPEDRREVVVVIPADEDRLHAVLEEPQDLLHLDPFVDEVLRELVLEVPRDDDLLRLVTVEHLAEALGSRAAGTAGSRRPALRGRPRSPGGGPRSRGRVPRAGGGRNLASPPRPAAPRRDPSAPPEPRG